MGRYIRKVKADFDWPLKQAWEGQFNPDKAPECTHCDGYGHSPEYRVLKDEWYGYHGGPKQMYNLEQYQVDALWKKGRLSNFKVRPTANEVNEWAKKAILGHDSINCWIALRAKLERLKQPVKCSHCKGDGVVFRDKEHEEACKNFEATWPEDGPCFQLWQDTSEDSPITPVFETLEELAEHCADEKNDISIFANDRLTKEDWLAMFKEQVGSLVYKQGNVAFI